PQGTKDSGRPLATGLQATAPVPVQTAIQARPPGAGAIPLPPLQTPSVALPSSKTTLFFCRGLDILQVLLALIFAFFMGSFVIRNSDFYQHLGIGKLIAEKNYTWGLNPLIFANEGSYWINHSWLFDLGLFRLLNPLKAEGLVVLKALLVV